MIGFKKAVRENIWTKTLLIGASGAGKSYGALRMATGFAKQLGKTNGKEERIAYIDTESRRSTYYAKEFDYDILELDAPFTPERYVEAIDMAIKAGYKVLVLDSMTHEWSGKGGCLEIHSKIPGNSYTAWRSVTPRHENFLDKIIDSPIHIFATVRGKDKYVLEEVNGKQMPRKIPLGYEQRDNTEYLFTVSFMIEQDSHIASSVKDNTHLFETKNDILTEKHGEDLCIWANDGDIDAKFEQIEAEKEKGRQIIKQSEEREAEEIVKSQSKKVSEDRKDDLKSILTLIDTIAKTKAKTNREDVMNAITSHHTSANYNTIENIEIANKVLEALQDIQ